MEYSEQDVDRLVDWNIRLVKEWKKRMDEAAFIKAFASTLAFVEIQESQIDEQEMIMEDCAAQLKALANMATSDSDDLRAQFDGLVTAAKDAIEKSLIKGIKLSKIGQARKGVKAKLAKDTDGKQREKAFILECWKNWQQSPSTYKSKAAFARDMLTKCESLTSQKKIEDWCREWEKETAPS